MCYGENKEFPCWELPEDVEIDIIDLEDHIERLLAAQSMPQ